MGTERVEVMEGGNPGIFLIFQLLDPPSLPPKTIDTVHNSEHFGLSDILLHALISP